MAEEKLPKAVRDKLSRMGKAFDKIDRANVNPRPKRPIPIWTGGFSEPAFRRGGRIADGFLFGGALDSEGSPFMGVLDGWERVKHHLAENGRAVEGFGAGFVMLTALDVDRVVETCKRWQDAGGTHASVVTMGVGLDSTDAHVDYIADVKAKLDV